MTIDDKLKMIAHISNEILKNGDKIYVREFIDFKWGNHALTSLPEKLALKHIFSMLLTVWWNESTEFINNPNDYEWHVISKVNDRYIFDTVNEAVGKLVEAWDSGDNSAYLMPRHIK